MIRKSHYQPHPHYQQQQLQVIRIIPKLFVVNYYKSNDFFTKIMGYNAVKTNNKPL